MVGVTGLEPMTSRPPAVRATNCAKPRYIYKITKRWPHGHLRRPRNFMIESTAFVRRFPCELPLAVLTPAVRATNCAKPRKWKSYGIYRKRLIIPA